jgi:hypothetical protein
VHRDFLITLYNAFGTDAEVYYNLCVVSYISLISLLVNVKVKVTLVQTLRLCTGRTARRGSRGTALLFHEHSTRRG